MTYQDALQRANELRGHGNAPFTNNQRHEIAELYLAVMGKKFRRTTCQNCYHDAVIEICCKLNKDKKMREKSKYILHAGVVLHCPEFDGGTIYTSANMTDDVAKRYLEKYPAKAVYFDIDESVKDDPKEEKPKAQTAKAPKAKKPVKKAKK